MLALGKNLVGCRVIVFVGWKDGRLDGCSDGCEVGFSTGAEVNKYIDAIEESYAITTRPFIFAAPQAVAS
jgi:hypothetical protein